LVSTRYKYDGENFAVVHIMRCINDKERLAYWIWKSSNQLENAEIKPLDFCSFGAGVDC
jgi:hypothetical protein